MSELKTERDLYRVIINNTKTVAQHVEEDKWRICGSSVTYNNDEVTVIKHLDLAKESPAKESDLLLHIVSYLDDILNQLDDTVNIMKGIPEDAFSTPPNEIKAKWLMCKEIRIYINNKYYS